MTDGEEIEAVKRSREDTETLTWLDDSLAYVRDAGQTKAEALLRQVRIEVLEELDVELERRAEDQP